MAALLSYLHPVPVVSIDRCADGHGDGAEDEGGRRGGIGRQVKGSKWIGALAMDERTQMMPGVKVAADLAGGPGRCERLVPRRFLFDGLFRPFFPITLPDRPYRPSFSKSPLSIALTLGHFHAPSTTSGQQGVV